MSAPIEKPTARGRTLIGVKLGIAAGERGGGALGSHDLYGDGSLESCPDRGCSAKEKPELKRPG
jgi:hypothetical protein